MFDRHQRVEVELALRDTPVVMVHGPRQTGKSTLAKSINYPYVTLDDFAPLGLAQQDPTAFLSAHGTPLTALSARALKKFELNTRTDVNDDK